MYPTAKPRQDGASERYRPCTISIWKVLETALRFSGVRSYIRATRPVYYVVRSPTYLHHPMPRQQVSRSSTISATTYTRCHNITNIKNI